MPWEHIAHCLAVLAGAKQGDGSACEQMENDLIAALCTLQQGSPYLLSALLRAVTHGVLRLSPLLVS